MRQSVIRSGQIFAEINLLTLARFSDKMFCLMIEVTPEVTVNYTKDFKTITVKLSKTKQALKRNTLILNSAGLFLPSDGYIYTI